MKGARDLSHSIHVRLVKRSKELGIEAQAILEQYALQRLLYRLSISPYSDRFLLKGAQMMYVWIGESVRATRDVDLLGFGSLTDRSLGGIFAEFCTLHVRDDGMEYLPDSIRILPIREQNMYGGHRILLDSRLGNAKLQLQVDVGIGDAVTPEPEWVELPQLLDAPVVRLRGYRPETTVAEKLQTIVSLGLVNSRMKDYFDLYVLSRNWTFDKETLCRAVRDTFAQRGTRLPDGVPTGLTHEFAQAPGKAVQWKNYVKKVSPSGPTEDLERVVDRLAAFACPVLASVAHRIIDGGLWPPGGPWTAGRSSRTPPRRRPCG